MQVNELTIEEFKSLIRETVRETIAELLADSNKNQTVTDNLKQQEQHISSIAHHQNLEDLSELHSWTQSLIGVISLDSENLEESYVNYLEEKYS
ncbi:MAG: hypothetical protein ACRAVC_15960 [Trichormus sp.]